MTMRHVIFSDAKDENKMLIVPEASVVFTIQRDKEGGPNTIIAEYNGKRVALPPDTQATFVELAAITPIGGIGINTTSDRAAILRKPS